MLWQHIGLVKYFTMPLLRSQVEKRCVIYLLRNIFLWYNYKCFARLDGESIQFGKLRVEFMRVLY